MNYFRSLLVSFQYRTLKGAVVVKIIQMGLQMSGHAPWPEEQAEAVESIVDSVVAFLAIAAVQQAHHADPNAPKP